MFCLSVVNTKISKSRDLGTWATHKQNELVEIIEKLASSYFKSFGKAHERHKTAFYIGYTYQLHPLMLSAHAHNLAEYVGKGHQQVHTN